MAEKIRENTKKNIEQAKRAEEVKKQRHEEAVKAAIAVSKIKETEGFGVLVNYMEKFLKEVDYSPEQFYTQDAQGQIIINPNTVAHCAGLRQGVKNVLGYIDSCERLVEKEAKKNA